ALGHALRADGRERRRAVGVEHGDGHRAHGHAAAVVHAHERDGVDRARAAAPLGEVRGPRERRGRAGDVGRRAGWRRGRGEGAGGGSVSSVSGSVTVAVNATACPSLTVIVSLSGLSAIDGRRLVLVTVMATVFIVGAMPSVAENVAAYVPASRKPGVQANVP